ncbi:hypothetical protein [Asinibacterium sp. OR53]|nr:hypothetical protein [Asinibacterium sp. OR53]
MRRHSVFNFITPNGYFTDVGESISVLIYQFKNDFFTVQSKLLWKSI